MKKSFLLSGVASLLFLCGAASAQVPHFGGIVGLNFANLNGSDVATAFPGNGTRTGLVIGGFMTYDFAPFFGLEPEVLYSMKGTSGAYQGVSYTASVNYIEVPVLLKFYIPLAPGTPVKADIYAGPDFAFNVASTLNLTYQGQSQSTDEGSSTNSFDFELAFGGGVGFGVGPTTLGIQLRYALGTGTIDKGGSDVRNGLFSLMASVGF